LHASSYGRGSALDLQIDSPQYDNKEFGVVPFLEAVATLDEANEQLAIFAVNRNPKEPLLLEADVRSMEDYEVIEHLVLENEDIKARNTAENPNAVIPHSHGKAAMQDGKLQASLPKLSWNVIRLGKSR
jgi:alpha-N-arabinofuranosidase